MSFLRCAWNWHFCVRSSCFILMLYMMQNDTLMKCTVKVITEHSPLRFGGNSECSAKCSVMNTGMLFVKSLPL